ncbi:hypothetical protein Droror1_Dr00002298 [Drosera rotundifolia]
MFVAEEALRVFEWMRSSDVVPDAVTFIGVLSACSCVGYVEKEQASPSNGLMLYFSTKGDFRAVQKFCVMVRQSRVQPDGYLYKVLIRAYCKSERAPLALRLFEDMRNSKLSPDLATKSQLIGQWTKLGGCYVVGNAGR